MLNYTRHEILNKTLEAFGDLKDDEELGPADWVTVKKYITGLSNLEDEHAHPHDDNHDHIHTMNLRDGRVRLLNGRQPFVCFSFLPLNSWLDTSIILSCLCILWRCLVSY